MAQKLKEEVRKSIKNAALEIFTAEGYENAVMSSIARKAGISVGNIYNYYDSKDDLFYELITPSFVARFKKLMQSRVKTARGVRIEDFSKNEDLQKINSERFDFFFQNRLEIIILLRKSKGTIYEHFAREMRDMFVDGVKEYFEEMEQVYKKSMHPQRIFMLEIIYDNFFVALTSILEKYEDKDSIKNGFLNFLDYHLAGLTEL